MQEERSDQQQFKLELFDRLPKTALCSFWFDHSSDIVVLLDLEGKVIMLNQKCADLLGGQVEDFIQRRLEDVLPDEHAEERNQEVKRVIASRQGNSWDREIQIGREKRWLKTIVEPVLESDGSVGAVLVMAADITDSKRVESKMKNLENKYVRLFETAQEAILIADDEGNYLDANPFVCELLGYSKEELLEIGSWGITPSMNRENWAPMWKKFIEDGAMHGEYQVKRKDGVILDMEFNAIANFLPGQHLSMLTDITARKKAEQALRQSEVRYRRLFENSLEGIAILDDEGHLVDANPKILDMFEVDNEQMYQINFLEKFLTKIQIPVAEKIWNLLRKEGTVEGVLDVSIPNSEIRQIEYFGVGNITPGQHLFQIKDITARKAAEKKLIESEAQYSQLVEESPGTVLVVQNDTYVFANPKAAEILGYERPEDVVGVNIFDSLTERSKKLVEERAQRAVAGERNSFTLLEILQPNDSTRMIESISVPYVYHGEPAVLVIGYDVTEKYFTATRLSSFYQVAPIGAGVIVDRCFVEVNQYFCEMTGYSSEELVGMSARELYFTDEEYERVGKEKLRQIVERGQATVETQFRHKNGEAIHVVLSSMPLDPQDLSKGLSATAMDITKRKQMEEDLKELNEELEERVMQRTAELRQRNKDLESFTNSMSHDLRGPLRAITGFTQILLNEHRGEWDEESHDLFNRVLAAGKRMDLLIEGLLLLAKMGQKNLLLESIDLGELAEDIYQNLMINQPDRAINAAFQKGGTVWADRGLMEVAMSHLLANAIRFTEVSEQAEIKFGYDQTPNGVITFYLKDNGTGFNPSLSDKLFVPFQRLEENVELEGLGLGLAIVHKVIERHAGEIWAEGAKGKGATFYFSLRNKPEMVSEN